MSACNLEAHLIDTSVAGIDFCMAPTSHSPETLLKLSILNSRLNELLGNSYAAAMSPPEPPCNTITTDPKAVAIEVVEKLSSTTAVTKKARRVPLHVIIEKSIALSSTLCAPPSWDGGEEGGVAKPMVGFGPPIPEKDWIRNGVLNSLELDSLKKREHKRRSLEAQYEGAARAGDPQTTHEEKGKQGLEEESKIELSANEMAMVKREVEKLKEEKRMRKEAKRKKKEGKKRKRDRNKEKGKKEKEEPTGMDLSDSD